MSSETKPCEVSSRGLRLIAWNVRAGGGQRRERQIAALSERTPDLVALVEVTLGSRRAYREKLAPCGLTHVLDSFELATDPSLLRGPRRYGQLLASRWPLTDASCAFPVPWPERVLSARVHHPATTIALHATHVPPGSSNGWIKVRHLEGLHQHLACASADPRILLGDFNTPKEERADGTVVTWGRKTKPGWDEAERNVLLGLQAHDLSDVFRGLHGYGVTAWSFVIRNSRRRYDHVFASASLQPIACKYLEDHRVGGLSDHAPIEVDFALPS